MDNFDYSSKTSKMRHKSLNSLRLANTMLGVVVIFSTVASLALGVTGSFLYGQRGE